MAVAYLVLQALLVVPSGIAFGHPVSTTRLRYSVVAAESCRRWL
jgi:hypothetical protein